MEKNRLNKDHSEVITPRDKAVILIQEKQRRRTQMKAELREEEEISDFNRRNDEAFHDDDRHAGW
jgi:hypothetical protein